jgi:hypothetical protein
VPLKPGGAGELLLRAEHKVSRTKKIARIEPRVARLCEQLGDAFAVTHHREVVLAAIGISGMIRSSSSTSACEACPLGATTLS